jgi:cob(I)alamin adenosyltransferase
VVAGQLDPDVEAVLSVVQNELFDVGADFSTPVVAEPEYPPLRVLPAYVDRLEAWCDHYNDQLTTLTSFILPGGHHRLGAAARRHDHRPASRALGVGGARGPRRHHEPARPHVPEPAVGLLFILARHANRHVGDVLWQPGGQRT